MIWRLMLILSSMLYVINGFGLWLDNWQVPKFLLVIGLLGTGLNLFIDSFEADK